MSKTIDAYCPTCGHMEEVPRDFSAAPAELAPQPPPANPPRGEFRPSTAPTVAADLRAFAAYLEKADADERQYAAEDLNALLDRWHDDDAFGTEGQCDPRGDHRS